jgi:hypothetical protein
MKMDKAGNVAVGDDTSLIIHVCDEVCHDSMNIFFLLSYVTLQSVYKQNRLINRDFKVNRLLLLSHMKYFTTYLSGSDAFDDIDISVHCDVHIFDWLVKYVHNQAKPPKLGKLYYFLSQKTETGPNIFHLACFSLLS